MKKTLFIALLITVTAAIYVAAGAKSEESSVGRSEYLAERGIITPAEEIYPSSFIGKVDYAYPQPEGPFGVTAYAGHRQVSSLGQEETLVIGLQGKRISFDELPPLNIAFVIDKSGSMADADKMNWVKESFEVFIEQVRSDDFVSLVVFDSNANVVFPSLQVRGNRERFRRAVRAVRPGGGTNLSAGLRLGYEQVMANYRKEYANRVLFLTDGVGNSAGIFEMAKTYRELGVSVSTIGLGHNFDIDLIRRLADAGGGSSRFISDQERMQEIFGHGLGRTAVIAANEVNVKIILHDGVRMLETWTYDYVHRGNRVLCPFKAIYSGDYETIVMKVDIPPMQSVGVRTIATIETNYTGSNREFVELDPLEIRVDVVDMENPVDGITNGIVLRASTMLSYALSLKEIGTRYYEGKHLTTGQKHNLHEDLLAQTNAVKKEVLNARTRLDYRGFEEELFLLDKYIEVLGGELEMDPTELDVVKRDREIKPVVSEYSLVQRLEALFREMYLDLQNLETGAIAVSGFALSDGREADLIDLLNEMAQSALSQGFTVVERQKIDAVLKEQELSLSDLMETTEAIKVGNMLAANYIVTGTVILMPSSVVIFGRIIDTETTTVESAAQVIVPRDEEVRSLL